VNTTKNLLLSVGTALAAVLTLLTVLRAPVAAKPLAAIRYVTSVTGNDAGDCTNVSSPCRSIQYAIDQSLDGDEIRIAAFDNVASTQYTSTGGSVISLTKSLTLRGGYVYQHVIGSSWITGIVPSLVDGEAARRAIDIRGPVTPTLELLSFVNGNATQGGNVYAENAALSLIAVSAMSGTAQSGGGMYLKNCHSSIDVSAILSGNIPLPSGFSIVQNNSAQSGAGIYIDGGNPLLIGLMVMSNTATNDGGGLYLNNAAAIIVSSSVLSNTSANGAGLYINGPLPINPLELPIIVNNYIRYNHAGGNGGGLNLQSNVAILFNNIVADNSATEGAGLYARGSLSQLFYSTIAHNTGNTGVYLTNNGIVISSMSLTNTIIASQTTSVYAASSGIPFLNNQVSLRGTLWWANNSNTGGSGTIVSSTNVYSDPLFTCVGDAPACLNPYHILTDSAAVDRGVTAVIPGLDRAIDIDWQWRPARAGFDIGADEVPDQYRLFVLPLTSTQTITPGRSITHTHILFNTGAQNDSYTLTLRGDNGWASLITPSPIALASQAVTDIQVRVDVPLTAINGLADITNLTITSWGDPARSFVVTDTTVITGGHKLFLPIVLD
jgi:hypothetical protein